MPVIEELKFFLTANSRAPELTPFNTPKVSLWPQFATANDRNAASTTAQGQYFSASQPSQRLLAFCSSFGTLTSGSSPSGKNEYFVQISSTGSYTSSTQDWSVPRNQDLASYLCNMGNRKIPGYGGQFRSPTTKYSDRSFSDIVIECLDYIRCCVAHNWVGGAPAPTGSAADVEPPMLVADTKLPGVSGTAPIKGMGYGVICPQFVLGETVNPTVVSSTATKTGTSTVINNVPIPFIAVDSFNPSQTFSNNTVLTLTFSNLANLGLYWQTVSTTGQCAGSPPTICLAIIPINHVRCGLLSSFLTTTVFPPRPAVQRLLLRQAVLEPAARRLQSNRRL